MHGRLLLEEQFAICYCKLTLLSENREKRTYIHYPNLNHDRPNSTMTDVVGTRPFIPQRDAGPQNVHKQIHIPTKHTHTEKTEINICFHPLLFCGY